MADEIISAPQAPVAATPAVAAPSPPPVLESAPVAAPAPSAPAAPPAPVSQETKVEAAAPEASAVVPPVTVLGAEPVKAAEKPVDGTAEKPIEDVKAEEAKSADPKKEEVAQSDEPAPLPTYEAFKLPDGLTADEKGFGEFTGLLAEAELAKGDHAKMQEFGQKLVDKHIAEVQSNLKRQADFFVNLFEKQKIDWRETFMKDPEIGGNRWETTAKAANEFISTHGGNDAQQKELRQLMESTGVGNHPAMIRIFAKAMVNMKEGAPLPAPKPEARPLSKVEKRYGKTST